MTIQLPDYTQEQLEKDTIRGFNGFACGIHEYRVRLTAAGTLFVNENPDGITGTAEWERVSAADRVAAYQAKQLPCGRWGDPDYVENIFRQNSF